MQVHICFSCIIYFAFYIFTITCGLFLFTAVQTCYIRIKLDRDGISYTIFLSLTLPPPLLNPLFFSILAHSFLMVTQMYIPMKHGPINCVCFALTAEIIEASTAPLLLFSSYVW